MNREWDIDPELDSQQRQGLLHLAERLERERPFPRPTFRGELRRRLLAPHRSPTRVRRYRALAVSYATLGSLCLVVAAIGLFGAGPFAA